ncbi:MAG: phosphodiester glycosidase family protein [Planctomycetes bacterium]|nr:phosphodiester glycosidase family protein [Planctomycetota bacterium]
MLDAPPPPAGPSRAVRCRQLALGALLALTFLAWLGQRLGYDALLAGGPLAGELALGDPQRPVRVERRALFAPAAQLIVAKVPRGAGYRLGVELTVPDAAALAGVSAPAKRRGALVAINGDYHRLGGSVCEGSPFSTFLEGSRWHALGSPYGYSCQFWLDAEGQPHVGRLDLRGQVQLPDGPLEVCLNQELGEALLLLRTPGAWRVPQGRVALPLELLDVRRVRVVGALRAARKALQGPALLAKVGFTAQRLRGLEVGAELSLSQSGADAGKPQLVVGTGPRLLEGGQVPEALTADPADTGWTIRVPRAAIGFDEEAVYLVATPLDPRAGLSLADFARALAALGCKEAVNLDGGPSPSLWAAGHGVTNSRLEPQVGTAVLVLPEAAAGVSLR